MPRGLEFHRIQNPIRIFGLGGEPVDGGEGMIGVAFQVERGTALEFGGKFGVTGAVNNGIHIHVAGDVRSQFGTFAGQNVHHAAGQIAGGQNFSEGGGGQREFFGSDHDGGISANDHGRDQRNQPEQGDRKSTRLNSSHPSI